MECNKNKFVYTIEFADKHGDKIYHERENYGNF